MTLSDRLIPAPMTPLAFLWSPATPRMAARPAALSAEVRRSGGAARAADAVEEVLTARW